MKPISLMIAGALGRMGRAIIELVLLDPRFSISGALVSSKLGQEIPHTWNFPVSHDLEELLPSVAPGTLIIDFSHFSQLESLLSFALQQGCPLLVGSTGHPSSHMTMLSRAGERIPVLFAPNTSIMANLMIEFSHLAAASLPGVSAHIMDIHHKHKKDAPSGTALAVKRAILSAEGELAEEVTISSARIGDVTGEHSVYFFKENERLEITHRVADRRIFAEGALFAALFLSKQSPGLYDMADVLNLNMTIENRPN